ncbi:MAG: hypothetical protein LC105_01710 [Chitinophagales bacterium]|nr:hypothetical protein [Chitinophagales bacterium]MCZ2392562.1 hypothetical protein [Chitinophagales bacterium]
MKSLYKIFIFNSIALFITLILISSCNSKKDFLNSDNDDFGFAKMDSIALQLEQIRVLFPTVDQWEEENAITYRKDSAIVIDKNGEMLLSKSFTINIDATKNIIVEQQYETILIIMNTENEDANLTKFKRYESPWTIIESTSSSNQYTKDAYSVDQIKKFPATSIGEVLDYIFIQTRTTKSEFDWNKYLRQAKTIYDFPFNIKISKITIRMKGEYLNNQPFKKYIVFKLI